jgi:zinc transport system ATP-binding protein
MNQNIFLKVTDLRVNFDNHSVLDGVSFEVKRDSTLAIVGPNGAGKTVLFKCLLGLISYQGKIEWTSDAKIGYVPQKLSVPRDLPLTVNEFFKLKENSVEKIAETLSKVGFKNKAEHVHDDSRVLETRLGSLSGGELQRVLMAYALLDNPNVLLLDEPTAGVDIAGEKTFYSLFQSLKENRDLTIIFISHDAEVVEKYADNIVKLTHSHN